MAGDFDADWWRLYVQSVEELEGSEDLSHDPILLAKLKQKQGKWSHAQSLALAGLEALPKVPRIVLPATAPRNDRKLGKLLDRGLQAAICEFEKAAQDGSESGPFVVHEYVPYPAFESWYKTKENVWRIAFQFTDSGGGTVLLYGDPSFLHEYVANWFGQVLGSYVARLMDECSSEYVRLLGSSRLIQAGGLHKEPDFVIQAVGSRLRQPPFVGEVAYANESLSRLKEELVRATVVGCATVAFGVKLTLTRNERGGFEKLRLRFLEKRQGCADFSRDIDFSPDKCTAAGMADFQVEFELETLFTGMEVDRRLMEGKVTFDLYKLQVQTMRLLENNEVDFAWFPRDKGGENAGRPLLGVKKRNIVKRGARNLLKKLKNR